VYAVAWNCLLKRGWKEAFESCWDDDKAEVERLPLYTDREVADGELLAIFVCKEEDESVRKPRTVVLGLAADNGAANAELLAERSIMVIT
jgi:hypothetical protein